MPLDGLRAIAVLWVFVLHAVIYNANYGKGAGGMSVCFKSVPPLAILGLIATSGGLAVDIFFVLSGFLISFILLKEYKKTGKIDISAFFRGRFLRLWPVMFLWAIFYSLVEMQ